MDAPIASGVLADNGDAPADGATAILSTTLTVPATFRAVELRENVANGERIDGWALDAIAPDGTVREILRGRSISIRRIRVLPDTVSGAAGLRLRVLSGDVSRGVPLPGVSFVLHDPPTPTTSLI